MKSFVALYPKYLNFKELVIDKKEAPLPEFGDRLLWKGQIHFVIAREEDYLTVIDEWAAMNLADASQKIENWQTDSTCIPLLSIEDLLRFIREYSGDPPTLTPGIRMAEEVWQVKHPGAVSVVSSQLNEALLDIAIQLLSPKKSSDSN